MPGPQDPQSILHEIRAEIARISDDPVLRQEANFVGRIEAIDRLEFHVLERLEGLPQAGSESKKILFIRGEAESLKRELEEINEVVFRRLRENILAGSQERDDFRAILREYAGPSVDEVESKPGYDNLDVFLNGLFSAATIPAQDKELEPEMVFYQKTPGHIVLELIERVRFGPADVFYDLGSGLGQVPLLANLLSGVAAKGVEYEPSYCEYAKRCAADLGLKNVTFVNADVRVADLADGTVFFLYTPFTGRMLQEVMEQLRRISERRPIRVFTYGPCTVEVSLQTWLWREGEGPVDPYRLQGFSSR